MSRWLRAITDWVATKKGMWWTLALWLAAIGALAALAPNVKQYEASSIETVPKEAQSMVAQKKIDQYFADSDGIPAIFVFHSDDRPISTEELQRLLNDIEKKHQEALEQLVPVASLPSQAAARFFAEDGKIAVVPAIYQPSLESKQIQTINDDIRKLVHSGSDVKFYITGPALRPIRSPCFRALMSSSSCQRSD